MDELWKVFVVGTVGAAGAGVLAGVVRVVKLFVYMAGTLDQLVKSDENQAKWLKAIAKIQSPQLTANRATLEALKGECNGNVDYAHKLIVDHTEEFNRFLAESGAM